jgi:hypothetical protein
MDFESFDKLKEYFEKNFKNLEEKDNKLNAMNRPVNADTKIAMDDAREAYKKFQNDMTKLKIEKMGQQAPLQNQ